MSLLGQALKSRLYEVDIEVEERIAMAGWLMLGGETRGTSAAIAASLLDDEQQQSGSELASIAFIHLLTRHTPHQQHPWTKSVADLKYGQSSRTPYRKWHRERMTFELASSAPSSKISASSMTMVVRIVRTLSRYVSSCCLFCLCIIDKCRKVRLSRLAMEISARRHGS